MQYLTQTPIASIIFIFTLITSLYAFNDQAILKKFMLHPYTVSKGEKAYTLITSGMIHANWAHLFFNMFTFFFFAFALEKMVGHWQFGIIYIGSLVFAGIPSVIKRKKDFWYHSLGASGAISGILFSYILFNPLSSIFVMFIPMPAIVFATLYLIYSWYMAKNANDNIGHDAHFFGALTGLILTILIIPGIIPHFISQLTGG